MRRLKARTFGILAAWTFVLIGSAGQARAQATIGDIAADPFMFYYAFYLPNQQVQSLRPKPIDELNQAAQNRQYYAQTQRQSLYNPNSPYTEAFDPLRPYSKNQGQEKVARPFRFAQDTSNSDGSGPALYYQRARSYYPTMRTGRGPNANVSKIGQHRGSRGGMGGGGMGGMGGGMGGMGGMGGFM